MRSTDLLGFFLLFLLDFWRPAEGRCSVENGTTALCHSIEDIKSIDTHHLHVLRISNAGKYLSPASFQNLSALRHLDLSKGDLVEIHPGSFSHLPQLLSLNLAENYIEHLNHSSLEGLKNLRNLKLEQNSFHHLPEELLNLKSLKALDVSGNQLDCNCATLRVRDKLTERGVKISKKAFCTGPSGVKGWSLVKPTSKLICLLDEQDEGMQMDQPVAGSAEGSGEVGSGDEADDEDELEEDAETASEVPEVVETPAPETPAPDTSAATVPEVPLLETPTPEATVEATQSTSKGEESITPASPVEVSLEKSKLKGDDGLFFDIDDKSSTENPPITQTEKSNINDDLVSLVEGSGEDDEFEGSGSIVPPIDFGKSTDDTVFENTGTDEKEPEGGDSLFERMFGNWAEKSTTVNPKEKTESEIVQEEFLPVVPVKTSEAEEMAPKHSSDLASHKPSADQSNAIKENGSTKQEIAKASSQDTKVGNGSMVVLIILLGVFVALVGLAAYKGDFCKKKRISDDLERGTELKEMQKSLLDGGNSVQPKISNGNMESVSLIRSHPQEESKEKESLNKNGNHTLDETPSAKSNQAPSLAPEILDPVKPPRKSFLSEEVGKPATNGKSNLEPYVNPEMKFRIPPLNLTPSDMKTPPNTPMPQADLGSPPLSPDAQRVKIILQENPDSVPKTPILITRTKMGENLVKTP